MVSWKASDRFLQVFGGSASRVAVSPGRVELIGNHTDYNGGKVIGLTIDRCLAVACRVRGDGLLSLFSDGHGKVDAARAEELMETGPSWARYVAGACIAASSRSGLPTPGFDIGVASDLPVGSGLSSSAALEVGTILAIQRDYGMSLAGGELARLAQRVENEYVGVPCGILDQGTVVHGSRDHAVLVDAAGPTFTPVPIPSGFRLVVFTPAGGHSLVDGLYGERYAECVRAWDALRPLYPEARGLCLCPEAGLDAVSLDPAARRRARHVIGEHQRVLKAVHALAASDLGALGSMLSDSHTSSQVNFENSSPEQDAVVAALFGAPGVFGSRLTGGGFGGSVIALAGPAFSGAEAQTVCDRAAAAAGGATTHFLNCRPAPGARLVDVGSMA